MQKKKQQDGFLMLTVALLIIVFGIVSAAIVHILISTMTMTVDDQSTLKALYLAEAGLEQGKHSLLSLEPANLMYRVACDEITGDPNYTNIPFGAGKYSVEATQYPLSGYTMLTTNIDITTTTLPVSSTAGYAPRGRIYIDHEAIDYTATTPTSFVNVTRATNDSVAHPHNTGTPVGQQQCSLLARGLISDVSNATTIGARELRVQAIQLDAGWAVGKTVSGNQATLFRWNGATWQQQPITGNTANKQLNDVAILSNTEGWAVGTNSLFIYWNGFNGNTIKLASNFPVTNLNSISCLSHNNCKAVGNKVNGKSFIAHWNGTNWAQASDNETLPNQDLLTIYCIATNDCWAGGTQDTSDAVLVHWNGQTWSRDTTLLENTGTGEVPNKNINDIECTNQNDCWAVGNRAKGAKLSNNAPNFLHWDGEKWSRFTSFIRTGRNRIPNVDLNSISCLADNNCWAVGKASRGSTTIAHWDGNTWQRIETRTLPNIDLNSIHCATNNNCWAVGNNYQGNSVAAYWNGMSWDVVNSISKTTNADLFSVFSSAPYEQNTMFLKDVVV